MREKTRWDRKGVKEKKKERKKEKEKEREREKEREKDSMAPALPVRSLTCSTHIPAPSGFNSADYLHVHVEAKKLAFADRAR